MFANYQNIDANKKPNNISKSFPVGRSYTKICPVDSSKPYEEYDVKGNLVGYFWRYGETLNLEFNIDGEITVEADAIVYTQSGQGPTSQTVAKINQRAYNVVDLVSWTCIAVNNDDYVWKKDAEFVYDESANRSVYVSASDYLKNKQLQFKLYNFRHEVIFDKTYKATTQFIFPITEELSKQLVKGIYYCSLTVVSKSSIIPIFSSSDCTLSVR